MLSFQPILSALLAHPGHSPANGFVAGLMHPLGGLDHLLAMVAVGLLAVRLRSTAPAALWVLPVAFVASLLAGGALALVVPSLPGIEFAIAGSVVLLGALLAVAWPIRLSMALPLVAIAGAVHGHAHIAELPAESGVAGYALGMSLMTAILHAAGIAAGLAAGRLPSWTAGRFPSGATVRVVGAGIAVVGIVLVLS
ncbi:hypothetical protein LBMAG53_00520 [Planctomycetota bacterium]|nr:hypothetical protein LBMAG53_00520 [Planctomycetota bacterium]